MAQILAQIEKIAGVDVPVLLLGESGVGKEVAARLIHKLSARRHRPFLKVNCAALPSELLESELFGYDAGAFTGAIRSKPGRLELCNKGTILLDEIGEMPPALQAKLLEVLQDGEFSRLGGRSNVKVDIRVLAATNIDMQKALANKQFRTDVYYRLNGFSLHIPPLRDRREEIDPLLDHFMDRIAGQLGCEPKPISRRVREFCLHYAWPGNVRELENFVKRYIILDEEEAALSQLESEIEYSLANSIREIPLSKGDSSNNLKCTLEELKAQAEKKAILVALSKAKWRRKDAAQLLDMCTKTLHYKMRRYGITDGRSRRSSCVANRPQERPVPSLEGETLVCV
jgi:transcriptional regulator with GAF, ATPase, and Fis domain